jgi:hypothetical protein
MTTETEENQEVQHAVVTVALALPVGKDVEDDRRVEILESQLETALQDVPPEFRRIINTDLDRTESMEEAHRRWEGEAEARAERKAARRRERYFDEHGHF